MQISPRAQANKPQIVVDAMKQTLIHTVFTKGAGFYPNYKQNNFMRNYKRKGDLDSTRMTYDIFKGTTSNTRIKPDTAD